MQYTLNTTNYHDFSVLEVNRLPGRSYFIPYPDRASADAVSAKERRYKSEKVVCLNGEWDFKFYPLPAELPAVLDTDSVDFDKLEVPSCWQSNGYGSPCYLNVRYPFPYNPPAVPKTEKVGTIFSWLGWDQGVHPRWKDPGEEYNAAGVYRRFLSVEDPSKRFVISFLGVASCLDLYCNGEHVGYGEGSHNTAEFDLTGKLVQGQNELVAVVRRWCSGSYLECQDMFRYNGIFRDVLLRVSEPSDFRDLDMRTVRTGDSVRKGKDGGTRGVYTLTLTAQAYADTDITFTVEGPGLKRSRTVHASGGAASVCFGGLDVAEWNAETPALYRVYFETPSCCVRENLGFRTVEIKGDTFLINGRKAKLHGVNHHDTDPAKGYAMSPDDIERDLLVCKQFQIDTIRTSHYPPDPLLLELAEELGIYIIDEGDMETHGVCTNQFPPDFNSITDNPDWQERCVDRTVRQYERDKLRGCTAVILWSLGNEAGGGCNTDAMYGWIKARASVPIHYESVIHTPITCYDVGSEMYPPVSWVHDVGEKRRKQAKLNDRPYIMCEYAHAMGVGPGNIEAYWQEIYKYDNLMGGCIWEFADHAVTEPDGSWTYGGDHGEPAHDGNFCVDGIFYPDRTPSTGAWVMKFIYRPLRVRLVERTGTSDGKLEKGVFEIFNTRAFSCGRRYEISFRWNDGSGYTVSPDAAPLSRVKVELPLGKVRGGNRSVIAVVTDTETGGVVSEEQIVLEQAVLSAPEAGPIPAGVTVKDGNLAWDVDGETVLASAEQGTIFYRAATDNDTNGLFQDTMAPFACQTEEKIYTVPMAVPVNGSAFSGSSADTRDAAEQDTDGQDADGQDAAGQDADGQDTAGQDTAGQDADGKGGWLSTAIVNLRDAALGLADTFQGTADGGVLVTSRVQCIAGGGILPRFGKCFRLDESFDQVEYVGRCGESYADMKEQFPVRPVSCTVGEMTEPNIRPQESGNRCDCTQVKLSNGRRTVTIRAVDAPFELAVKPYTDAALRSMKHRKDEVRTGTYVTVQAFQQGIGTASCGPGIAPEFQYNLEPEKEFVLRFVITVE